MFVSEVCSVFLRNNYVRVLKSVLDLIVSDAYIPPLPSTLKLFKYDTDHIFSTKYHQSLNPQRVFFLVNASFSA